MWPVLQLTAFIISREDFDFVFPPLLCSHRKFYGQILRYSKSFERPFFRCAGLSTVLFFLGLLATAALRDTLRRIALGKQLNLTGIPVHSQWDSFALFLVIFILGLMLVGYIVKEGFFNRPKLQVGG